MPPHLCFLVVHARQHFEIGAWDTVWTSPGFQAILSNYEQIPYVMRVRAGDSRVAALTILSPRAS